MVALCEWILGERNCSSLVPWFAFGDVDNAEEFLHGELRPCWAGQRMWYCAGTEANGFFHPWGLGKANPGLWGAPSLQIQVCAGCPVGLGSGADSCFFLPSVYLYVFG